jgi:hypothetical protein
MSQTTAAVIAIGAGLGAGFLGWLAIAVIGIIFQRPTDISSLFGPKHKR